jgi:hypothetical protein
MTDNAQVFSRAPNGPFPMAESLDKKVGEWRSADREAREAEKALARLPFFRGEGPPPAEDLISEAKQLRRLADEKLKAAIEAMKPTASVRKTRP